MKRILIYGPYNTRARDIESVAERLKQQGHEVFFLTLLEGNDILPALTAVGVNASSTGIVSKKFIVKWIRELFFVMSFCRKNKIDVLFSHLEPAHVVSVIAQFFIRARVIICRHHVDEIELLGGNKTFSYRMIYKLGREFLVVSQRTRQYMIEKENIKPDKIRVINLLFDFNKFYVPDEEKVAAIQARFKARLLLLTISRLVEYKRPGLSVEVLKQLTARGLDVHLIILGQGELMPALKEEIVKSGLSEKCSLLGYTKNVMDYLKACDVLLHPSLLDSSSMVIKEAGLLKKTVIGCEGLGLLDDKLINNRNGFVVGQERFVGESVSILLRYYEDRTSFQAMGEKLYEDVLANFSIEKRIREYDFIN